MFGGGDGFGFGFAAEDEAAAFAALVGGVVDLLPEADEVIDGRDDGDDGHPVDGGDGDEVDANDEAAVEYFIGFWKKIDHASDKRRKRRSFVLSRKPKPTPAAEHPSRIS